MLGNTLYYTLKPFVPRSLRMAVRGWFARRKRKRVGDIWPILPGCEPPDGWRGWPDGKRFAFVLTHDVETQRGLDRVKRIAELEMRYGFRSSFNFIPEGPYAVSSELRSWLVDRGFEVGVHDLHHDGKLYSTRKRFRSKTQRINHYLKNWNAAGFRSGFMLNRLGWLHDLDVQYDASTFDTDPFEPQPEGAGTIFPFWVPAPRVENQRAEDGSQQPGYRKHTAEERSPFSGSPSAFQNGIVPGLGSRCGYAELPYTLPQDSTLFLLLGEQTPEIWFRKLDLISEKGGMAMVIVHPDYVRFENEPPSSSTFPIKLYESLLVYLQQRYENSFWPALPREVGAFTEKHKPLLRTRSKRVCMLTYSHYKRDARVARYAKALAERGDHVDVFALRSFTDDPISESADGVNLYCHHVRTGKQEKTHRDFLFPVIRFTFSSMIWATRRHIQQPYDLFHIHNVPDLLVLAAWYPKLRGARVILDIHDIMPELYANKFGVQRNTGVVRALKLVERVSAWFADHVIISNHLWLEKYSTRTGARDKCSVFINNVDRRIFHPGLRTKNDERRIILFPGGLQWHQGLDIALRAFKKINQRIPNAEFHIYGDGVMKPALQELAQNLGLNGNAQFFQPLPVQQIAKVMANADLGVVPKRADSFGDEAYSTKIMEFMAVGVPVVVSDTKVDRYYFNNSVVQFFESGNPDALAAAMLELLLDAERRGRVISSASSYASSNDWENRKRDYLRCVDSLCRSSQRER